MSWRNKVQMPNWDGRMMIAAVFILGYYAVVWRMMSKPLPAGNVEMVKDSLLVLGPAIGVIVGALFRNTLSDERMDSRRSTELHTAIVTPTAQPAPAAAVIEDAVHDGAKTGARAGVAEGLEEQRPDPGVAQGFTGGAALATVATLGHTRQPAPGVYSPTQGSSATGEWE